MPRGKASISGYGFARLPLAGYSNIDFLLRHRLPKLPPATVDEIERWDAEINDVVSTYVCAAAASQQPLYNLPTSTEQRAQIRKVIAASKQLLNALDKSRHVEARAKKLWELLAMRELGLHIKNTIHRAPIFYQNGRRIGDIFKLEKALQHVPVQPLDVASLTTVQLLAAMELPPQTKGKSLGNPLWRDLIPPLASLWVIGTGKSPMPNNMEGVHLFKDWVLSLIQAAADQVQMTAAYLMPNDHAVRRLAAPLAREAGVQKRKNKRT